MGGNLFVIFLWCHRQSQSEETCRVREHMEEEEKEDKLRCWKILTWDKIGKKRKKWFQGWIFCSITRRWTREKEKNLFSALQTAHAHAKKHKRSCCEVWMIASDYESTLSSTVSCESKTESRATIRPPQRLIAYCRINFHFIFSSMTSNIIKSWLFDL